MQVQSEIVEVGLATLMTLLEDKSVVGGSGLATERKPKAEISV